MYGNFMCDHNYMVFAPVGLNNEDSCQHYIWGYGTHANWNQEKITKTHYS